MIGHRANAEPQTCIRSKLMCYYDTTYIVKMQVRIIISAILRQNSCKIPASLYKMQQKNTSRRIKIQFSGRKQCKKKPTASSFTSAFFSVILERSEESEKNAFARGWRAVGLTWWHWAQKAWYINRCWQIEKRVIYCVMMSEYCNSDTWSTKYRLNARTESSNGLPASRERTVGESA